MRIFLTGIEGFVGRHLARRLSDDGHAVWGSALAESTVVAGAEKVEACDVDDGARVEAVLRAARPDAVVHLAGQTSGTAALRDPAATFRVNALGALNVLEACRAADVARVLLVTSSEAYGEGRPADGPVVETRELAPVTSYGASKAAQELLGAQYGRGYGLSVVRARAFPHTGPGQDARFVFPSVARRIARAESGSGPAVLRMGRLDATRDYADVRDVVAAYAALLERGVPGEAYNVCRGVGRTIGEALAVLCAEAHVPIRLESDPAAFRTAEVQWMVGDSTKLCAATGWQARYTWQETMRDLLADWRVRVAEGRDGADDEPYV